MDRELAVAVARLPRAEIDGVFERHTAPSWAARALVEGSRAGGRWAAAGSFPVIYLGRPTVSVVIEAYRHLVDDVEGMTGERVRNRRLLRARVRATNVLDLRAPVARVSVGLAEETLRSAVDDYKPCQQIGHVAHQLGCHGVIAPAATGLGETLALFVDLLGVEELPVAEGPPVIWDTLPADPRRLRVVEGGAGA